MNERTLANYNSRLQAAKDRTIVDQLRNSGATFEQVAAIRHIHPRHKREAMAKRLIDDVASAFADQMVEHNVPFIPHNDPKALEAAMNEVVRIDERANAYEAERAITIAAQPPSLTETVIAIEVKHGQVGRYTSDVRFSFVDHPPITLDIAGPTTNGFAAPGTPMPTLSELTDEAKRQKRSEAARKGAETRARKRAEARDVDLDQQHKRMRPDGSRF